MQSFNCNCAERKKPVKERNWVVWQRQCRRSAFDGYREMPSDYSTVVCKSCRGCGRTKAAFVKELRDEDPLA